MTRRRLWVASELYYPEETSTGYFLTRIAEGLADTYDVRVISGRPAYSQRDVDVTAHEVRHGTVIHRMMSTRFDKDRLLLRLVNLLSFSLAAFVFTFLHVRRGDMVLVVTNPPTLPLVIGSAAGLRGARRILLVHDVYPDVLAAAGVMTRSSLLYRGLDALFCRTLAMFDRIAVLGRDMQVIIERKLGRGDHLRLIPNWGDSDEIFPMPDRAANFRRMLGLDGKIIVQFSGNIGRTHDVDEILAAVEMLAGDIRFHILFVGYGGKAEYVKQQIQLRRLKNVTFLPRQPREKLNEMLNASDLTIISLTDKMFGLSVPSRMYNVMSAGAPILAIASPQSELALTVAENQAGWVINHGDSDMMIRLIRSLSEEEGRDEAARRGWQGRASVTAHFQFDEIVRSYRLLLAEFETP